MSRSGFSPLLATLQLVAIGIGVPMWAISRLGGSLLPVRASDLILLVALACWALLVKAFVERNDALDSLTSGKGSAGWYAHRLIDESLVGVGLHRDEIAALAPLAMVVTMPRELHSTELPPELPWMGLPQGSLELIDGERPIKTMPTLHAVESDEPIIGETEEYVVSRGDTFWSIAEATLGDGRDWTALQDLNIGREVAADRLLVAGDQLRIGWSILVPVVKNDLDDEI